MRSISNDFIMAGTLNAQENTWNNRYNSDPPNIKKEGVTIRLWNANNSININSFDEAVLTIILKFLFAPVWLVKQFYSSISIAGSTNPDERLKDWVDIGLVWREGSVTGEYLRPTYLLFKLFGQAPITYTDIPFNMLTHTISEQKVMFDIMTGRSPILNRETVHPRISELGFEHSNIGTNVIAEEDFRYPGLFTQAGIEDLRHSEHLINEGIRNGEDVTLELSDFKKFVIAKKVDNTGTVKSDYRFHIPDLVIPVIRDKGKPRSIAIEVELSNKRITGYTETIMRYKNNNRFGCVYWFCNSSNIADSIRQAYQEAGGAGSCRMVLLDFVIPSPDF